jgi:uncharacterized membrane protein HdeD (DUF308 family)
MTRDDEGGNRVVSRGGDRDDLDAAAGHLFKRAWWAIALRGALAIVLGLVILTRPGVTLAVLIAMIGIYLFFDGLFTLGAAFHAAQKGRSWWPYVLEGLLSVGVGLLAFARPASMALFLVILIAARAIVVGLVEIGTGISVRRTSGSSTWLLWLGGLASVVFGILLLANPAFGLITLVWMVGIYTIAFGVLMDATAFQLKSAAPRQLTTRPT